jgi:hypothetical protein
VLLPLAFANRWAIWASAPLGGMGIGLFIDEVGKFITQSNDYFFPPALSIVYGFFLLTFTVYLVFRRPQRQSPRRALYHALDRLKDAVDRDLDADEAARIESQLAAAKQPDQHAAVALAEALSGFLQAEDLHPSDAVLLPVPVFGAHSDAAPVGILACSACLSALVLEGPCRGDVKALFDGHLVACWAKIPTLQQPYLS